MIKAKTIQFRKKEAILLKWYYLVTEEKDRRINFLMKQALLSYIKERKYIEIGRIHFNSQKDIYEKNEKVNLWINDVPIVQDWIIELSKQKIKVGPIIKEIIRKSIVIVPESEDEFIPTYSDFDSYVLDLDVVSAINTVKVEEPKKISNIKSINMTNNEKVSTPEPRVDKKPEMVTPVQINKKGTRASILGGKRYT